MSESESVLRGGCLCGQLRYEARGKPRVAGYCYCADCRKASGSGFIPFMGFASSDVTFSGRALQARTPSFRGGESVRNFCPDCGGLVFGGDVGEAEDHTIYAGSLDDVSAFHPTLAIFARDRPEWVLVPSGVTVFETLPDV